MSSARNSASRTGSLAAASMAAGSSSDTASGAEVRGAGVEEVDSDMAKAREALPQPEKTARRTQ
jgi:hypothetical protein